MKCFLGIAFAMISLGGSYAMSIVEGEPKYSTKEYIQSFCILEFCPQHINDKEFEHQKVIPAKACYQDCCKKYGGCPKEYEN